MVLSLSMPRFAKMIGNISGGKLIELSLDLARSVEVIVQLRKLFATRNCLFSLDFDLKPPLLLISALSPETAGFKSQGLK